MCTLLKVMCVSSLKKRITLPKDWFKQTESCYVFTYCIDGRMRFIQVEKDEDGAQFFVDNGFISSYEGSGKYLTMYNIKTIYVSGKNGEPVEWVRSSVVGWNDIKIYASDVVHFAANHEYEITGSILGLSPAKPKAKVRIMDFIMAA